MAKHNMKAARSSNTQVKSFTSRICNKVAFIDRNSAKIVSKKMQQKKDFIQTEGDNCLVVFKCETCNHWHIGNSRR